MGRIFRIPAFLISCDNTLETVETAIRRQLEEHIAPGEEILFVSSGDGRESSVERSICQAAAWVTMPAPVRCDTAMQNAECRMQNGERGTGNGDWGMAQAVLTPYFDEDANAVIAATERFQETGAVVGRRFWVKKSQCLPTASGREGESESGRIGTNPGNPVNPVKKQNPAPNRQTVKPSNCQTAEAAGLLPLLGVCLAGGIVAGATGVFVATTTFSLFLFALVLCGVGASPVSVWLLAVLSSAVAYAAGQRRETNSTRLSRRALAVPLLLGVLVFFATGLIALAHRFVTPYGLAITGGRAKLWFLSGGIPGGFFSDAAWRLLEPTYPPGCAALTFGCYGASGICGDWLTQLAPCVFAAVAAAFLTSRTKGLARLWIALFFLTPVALMTTGQFYPEPLMALGVLVGWERIRNGQFGGWLLLGAAGWFKNEGLMLLFAAWLAWRIVAGENRARMRDFAAAMALPLVWHVGCRLAGASLNDYVAPWRLSPLRGLRALGKALRLAFARPWDYGFAYPAALVAVLVPSARREVRPLLAALLFAAFAVAFFCLAYACSTADEAWHLSTSLPRLLWTPALILAREVAAICNPERDSL